MQEYLNLTDMSQLAAVLKSFPGTIPLSPRQLFVFRKMNLFDFPTTEDDALEFLQERGVISKQRVCSSGHEMPRVLR